MPHRRPPDRFRVLTDTSDFHRVDFDDVVLLAGTPYLVRGSTREGRFGMDEQVKHWVKRAVDLRTGEQKILKFVFLETFRIHVGSIVLECYRSPYKEARILDLVRGHPNFMHGFSAPDARDNLVRIVEVITGSSLHSHILQLREDHETYFHRDLPGMLDHYIQCVEAIALLHGHGEKHGDIRRDHLWLDEATGRYRWIDFDYDYRHVENLFGYDLFCLGNVLAFIVGKGDLLVQDARTRTEATGATVEARDLNVVFKNRILNLKKFYPYIPELLNRVLMNFSEGSNRFYEHAGELLEDLRVARAVLA